MCYLNRSFLLNVRFFLLILFFTSLAQFFDISVFLFSNIIFFFRFWCDWLMGNNNKNNVVVCRIFFLTSFS